MATVASGLNGGAGYNSSDTITSTTLNNHVNNATVTGIVDADVASNAAIAFTKLAPITSQKVIGSIGSGNAEIDIVGTNGLLLDEDDLVTDSNTKGATQQSVKAYVDNSSTDGFTPTSYTGEESVTLPNGLILKWGSVSVGADSTANATFGTAFPNAIVSAQATLGSDFNPGNDAGCAVYNLSTTGLTVRNGWQGTVTINWHAIGR
jgi:hypothetical protein